MLQRQVKVRREAARRRNEIHDLARAVHRLERRNAEDDALGVRRGAPFMKTAQQIDERGARLEIASVRSEVDAGQRDFLEARRHRAVDVAQHLVRRGAPRRAARRRDDAIRARLGAAGLDAQRVSGAAGDARHDRRAARAVE